MTKYRREALQVCSTYWSPWKIFDRWRHGKKDFIATLSPIGTAAHGRAGVQAPVPIQFESFPMEFANRMPWGTKSELAEPLDGDPTVLIDHDLAMVWTPYYFLKDGEVTHVGTICFTFLKGNWDALQPGQESSSTQSELRWKITGMTDTARLPTPEDLSRISKGRGLSFKP